MLQVAIGDGGKVGCWDVQVTCLSAAGNLLFLLLPCFSVLVCFQVPPYLVLSAGSGVGGSTGSCSLLACPEPARSCWLCWGLVPCCHPAPSHCVGFGESKSLQRC